MASRPKGSSSPSATNVTRRTWTAAFSAGLASVFTAVAAAQVTSTAPPTGAPAPAAPAETPEQKLQKAYADIRETSDRLAKIEVPMDVEPAFAFRP